MTAIELAELLSRHRYRIGHETLLQEDVEALLRREKVDFERECVLSPGDRVDFLVGTVALELKIKASARRILAQLTRYAIHDNVDSLVLMTVSALGLPREINGKRLYVVPLGRMGL